MEPSSPTSREAGLAALTAEIVACRACPRLVAWRELVAREKVARHRDETYWGRPLPGFGDPAARVLIVGLAPAAHGGNRTGRVFTGDRSGDVLWAALHATGFADRPASRRADDGLTLRGAYVAAAVRCAPPANKPTIDERDRCLPYLARELGASGRRAGDPRPRGVRLGRRAPRPRRAGSRRAATAAVRPRGGGARRPVSSSSAPTTRASRTRSPAG